MEDAVGRMYRKCATRLRKIAAAAKEERARAKIEKWAEDCEVQAARLEALANFETEKVLE